MKPLDQKFISRVYRTTVWLALLLSVAVWARFGGESAAGMLAGTSIGLGSLSVIERGVKQFIRPGVQDYRPLALYGLGMYPLLLVALWIVVEAHVFNLPAVAVGIALPQVVIVLKVLGRNLNNVTGGGLNSSPRENSSGQG